MRRAPYHSILRSAEQLYRILLLAYPAAYRSAYGPSMLQLFRDLCRDAYRQGGLAGFLRLEGRVLVDTAVSAVIENSEVIIERGQIMTPQQHVRVIAHAGLPVVLGVALFLINPNYMSRMLMPNRAQPIGWFMTAAVFILAGATYIVERRIFIQSELSASGQAIDGRASRPGRTINKEFALAVSALFLVLPAVLLVVLGPAYTMVREFLQK